MINILFIFLIVFSIFYIFNKNINNVEKFINKKKDIDIIIARYNEDLKWTLEKPFNKYQYIVYNKGTNNDFEKSRVKKIINLPNVGKCDHTYVYHIIKNYDNLSDIQLFLPGSVDMPHKKKIASKILYEIEERNKAVFISLNETDVLKNHYNTQFTEYMTTYEANRNINPEIYLKKSSIRPFGKWFENKFGNIKVDCMIYYGVFSIDKNDILQHPKSRYENLIDDLSDHSNPEAGHYFERSWCAIFYPLKNTFIIKYEKII